MNNDMSDSQFIKFQDKVQEKMKNYMDKFDNESRIRMLKKRFESSKGRKKTLWEKVKQFIGIN